MWYNRVDNLIFQNNPRDPATQVEPEMDATQPQPVFKFNCKVKYSCSTTMQLIAPELANIDLFSIQS